MAFTPSPPDQHRGRASPTRNVISAKAEIHASSCKKFTWRGCPPTRIRHHNQLRVRQAPCELFRIALREYLAVAAAHDQHRAGDAVQHAPQLAARSEQLLRADAEQRRGIEFPDPLAVVALAQVERKGLAHQRGIAARSHLRQLLGGLVDAGKSPHRAHALARVAGHKAAPSNARRSLAGSITGTDALSGLLRFPRVQPQGRLPAH